MCYGALFECILFLVSCIAVFSPSNFCYYGQIFFICLKNVAAGIDGTCDGNSKGAHPLF